MLILVLTLFFLIFSPVVEAKQMAQDLCDPDSTKAELISPWKEKKDKHCMEVSCQTGPKSIKREKCFYQKEHQNEVIVTYEDVVSGPELLAYQSRAEFVRLHDGEACFDACRPQEKKGIFKNKIISGLERESCRQCFEKRAHAPYDESFEYKEIGKRLYPSQKCFLLCRDPKGPIVTERKLSPECLACVGGDGIAGESFEYMLDQEGECFEVDSERKVRTVPRHLCAKQNQLILTHYENGSAYTVKTILFKEKPECHELDNRTNGSLYKKIVHAGHCDIKDKDNSDRNIIPEKNPNQKSRPRLGNGSSHQ